MGLSPLKVRRFPPHLHGPQTELRADAVIAGFWHHSGHAEVTNPSRVRIGIHPDTTAICNQISKCRYTSDGLAWIQNHLVAKDQHCTCISWTSLFVHQDNFCRQDPWGNLSPGFTFVILPNQTHNLQLETNNIQNTTLNVHFMCWKGGDIPANQNQRSCLRWRTAKPMLFNDAPQRCFPWHQTRHRNRGRNTKSPEKGNLQVKHEWAVQCSCWMSTTHASACWTSRTESGRGISQIVSCHAGNHTPRKPLFISGGPLMSKFQKTNWAFSKPN